MDLVNDEPRRLCELPTWGNGHLYCVAPLVPPGDGEVFRRLLSSSAVTFDSSFG
jgi:hypothetical protein